MIPDNEMHRLAAVATSKRPLEQLVNLRARGYPLQYLEGTAAFGALTVSVDERVLIPRPETEYLADLLSRRHPPPKVVVDLCTGSGALALFLKAAWPASRLIATDISTGALAVAVENGARVGLDVEWRQGDLFAALPGDLEGLVDLLVANPPYIADNEWGSLPIDVRHEPRRALVAGPLGTEVIDRILDGVRTWLAIGGEAWLEIGETQADYLAGRHDVAIHPDQYGKDRFAVVKLD